MTLDPKSKESKEPRFKIEKLEERVAPSWWGHWGWGHRGHWGHGHHGHHGHWGHHGWGRWGHHWRW
jgi:hypothetical protein